MNACATAWQPNDTDIRRIRISGIPASSCSVQTKMNQDYMADGSTHPGSIIYRGVTDGAIYLYHDEDCGGGFSPRWIFDTGAPSTTLPFNLQGGECATRGSFRTSETVAPLGKRTWGIYCGTTVGRLDLSITVACIDCKLIPPQSGRAHCSTASGVRLSVCNLRRSWATTSLQYM